MPAWTILLSYSRMLSANFFGIACIFTKIVFEFISEGLYRNNHLPHFLDIGFARKWWAIAKTVKSGKITCIGPTFIQFSSAIPKKFVDNIRDKMTSTVALRGPSGHVWNVDLVTNGDVLLLKNGWKAFVEGHSLVENDILIFKFNRNSRFDVSILNQESLCEKTSSYFVRKCEHKESGHVDKQKRNIEEGSEDTDEPSNDRVDDDRVKRRRSEAARALPSRIQPTLSASKGQRRNMRKQHSSSAYPVQLKSRRREVTEDEKNRAQQMATASSSESNFTVVMRASHVYKGFFMSIPVEWARIHFPNGSQEVELRVNDKTWVARYHYKGYSGGLSGGWKKFVLENFLEEFDWNAYGDYCTLNVKIFRVVEEVIPPSQVTRGPSRRLTRHISDSSSDDASRLSEEE
ncbi:hypothetical protein DH2020_004157 [Rehmannia glutinosa]|uniref:TF-B3 domain-containing protein n=1 Tax=Rehmannia glutinosa TaxID=99300 RepID=A0ABR0XNM1_REHGL